MKTYRFSPVFCLALAACSSSGAPTVSKPVVIDDTLGLLDQSRSSSNGSAVLTSLPSQTLVEGRGTIDRNDNSLSIGPISGSYAGGDAEVVLSSGGVATILDEREFSALVRIEQASGDELGVFGVTAIDVVTGRGGINSTAVGTGIYEGSASVVVQDADASYDLMGTVSVAVNFDEFTVGLTIDDLHGTRADQSGMISSVSDVATIEIARSELLGSNYFAGGAFDVTSTTLSPLSGVATINHSGFLFGPGGQEVGGALIIKDTSHGSLLLQGAYIGD